MTETTPMTRADGKRAGGMFSSRAQVPFGTQLSVGLTLILLSYDSPPA
jgi:hypothetical protein